MNELLSFARDGAIFDVRFGDAAGGNRISNADAGRIVAELAALPGDVHLVRIRSNGPAFCLGHVPNENAPPPIELYRAIREVPVPVLAIVEGAADGYGCAIVVACDLAVATEAATFRIAELDGGAPPLLVMTALSGRIAAKTIAHLALTREELGAEAALAAGIVSTVVPSAELEAYIERICASIAGEPLDSVRATKKFLRNAHGPAVAEEA